MTFYRGRRGRRHFDDGIEAALQRILADPEFIYRASASRPVWRRARAIASATCALASRLSFFLWSSIPDDELIDLAAQGGSRIRRCSRQQVRRMLSDPTLRRARSNFTGQWLSVRSLKASEPS
jgi:hypothetical protein